MQTDRGFAERVTFMHVATCMYILPLHRRLEHFNWDGYEIDAIAF